MTGVTFTSNLSGVIAIDGQVKFIASGDDGSSNSEAFPEGEYIELLEEAPDESYYQPVLDGEYGTPVILSERRTSFLFNGLGNYKLRRTSDAVMVGYVT